MDEPTIAEIRETRALIDPYVASTPVWQWRGLEIEAELGTETEVFLKLELFQQTGTFKARGALRGMLALSPEKLAQGVTAVSAGNHAIAVSYAARILGTTAKVVMFKSANPARVAICRAYGAEVELMDNVHQAFARVREIEEQEGRTFIHPFEGKLTILGTATVGLELCEAVPNLDAVIVPIGGGGLGAGIATAVKLLQPNCAVYGVEPEGADSMSRSFASGQLQQNAAVDTISDGLRADLGAPNFALLRARGTRILTVSDAETLAAMRLVYERLKIVIEPSCATPLAAIRKYPEHFRDRRVGVILSGGNVDFDTLRL